MLDHDQASALSSRLSRLSRLSRRKALLCPFRDKGEIRRLSSAGLFADWLLPACTVPRSRNSGRWHKPAYPSNNTEAYDRPKWRRRATRSSFEVLAIGSSQRSLNRARQLLRQILL